MKEEALDGYLVTTKTLDDDDDLADKEKSKTVVTSRGVRKHHDVVLTITCCCGRRRCNISNKYYLRKIAFDPRTAQFSFLLFSEEGTLSQVNNRTTVSHLICSYGMTLITNPPTLHTYIHTDR